MLSGSPFVFQRLSKRGFKKKASPFAKAFSLIEILLVLLIIAFVFAFVAQSFSRRDQKVKVFFEKMIRLNRQLSSLSKLHNQTYRWVIQLDNEAMDQYWVEKKYPRNKKPARLKKDQNFEFAMDASFYSKPQKVIPLLDITELESLGKEGQTEGLAYIYYYPKGLAQKTAIHISRPDNQAQWTLYLDPVTKKLQALKGRASLREL